MQLQYVTYIYPAFTMQSHKVIVACYHQAVVALKMTPDCELSMAMEQITFSGYYF